MLFSGILCAMSFVCIFSGHSHGAAESDRVLKLPGWSGDLPSKVYSGYLDVNWANETRNMHYVFIEAEHEPSLAPVVFWTNGGPGCSSMEGLMTEFGPFTFAKTDPSRLVRNPFTWNVASNILYLEQPVGVGFSYREAHKGDNLDKLVVTDEIAAEDNYQALRRFFALFPEYSRNKFFISGESYAGVYVPMLAERVTMGMDAAEWSKANGMPVMAGVLVGNGCTGEDSVSCGILPGGDFTSSGLGQDVQMARWHALIDKQVYDELMSCSPNAPFDTYTGCWTIQSTWGADCWINDPAEGWLWTGNDTSVGKNCTASSISSEGYCEFECSTGHRCCAASEKMDAAMGNINVYDVYGKCMADTGSKATPRAKRHPHDWLRAKNSWSKPRKAGFDACMGSDGPLQTWLRRDDVRAALHIPPSVPSFVECADPPQLYYQKTKKDVVPIYPVLLAHGVRVLIFTGDVDAAVPWTGTYNWTHTLAQRMGWNASSAWQAWNVDGQVAGYRSQWGNMVFSTIRDAGHMVPETQPERALAMYTRFLHADAQPWLSATPGEGSTGGDAQGTGEAGPKLQASLKEETGVLKASAAGGLGPYIYRWYNGDRLQATQNVATLQLGAPRGAGTYLCKVTDMLGDTVNTEAIELDSATGSCPAEGMLLQAKGRQVLRQYQLDYDAAEIAAMLSSAAVPLPKVPGEDALRERLKQTLDLLDGIAPNTSSPRADPSAETELQKDESAAVASALVLCAVALWVLMGLALYMAWRTCGEAQGTGVKHDTIDVEFHDTINTARTF